MSNLLPHSLNVSGLTRHSLGKIKIDHYIPITFDTGHKPADTTLTISIRRPDKKGHFDLKIDATTGNIISFSLISYTATLISQINTDLKDEVPLGLPILDRGENMQLAKPTTIVLDLELSVSFSNNAVLLTWNSNAQELYTFVETGNTRFYLANNQLCAVACHSLSENQMTTLKNSLSHS